MSVVAGVALRGYQPWKGASAAPQDKPVAIHDSVDLSPPSHSGWRRLGIALLAASACLGLPGMALAQTADPPPASTSPVLHEQWNLSLQPTYTVGTHSVSAATTLTPSRRQTLCRNFR